MLSEYKRKLLIKGAIDKFIRKLEKKLEREQIKLDKCIDSSMHLPARQGVRGGANTKLMAKVQNQADYVNELKESIEFLNNWNEERRKEFQNMGIGEIFVLGNIKFIVYKEKQGCSGCFFNMIETSCFELQDLSFIPFCQNRFRKDGINVYFEEVENEK